MLATGLLSAIVLGAAAWQPFADPRASARIEQARLADEAAAGMSNDWDALVRDPAVPVPEGIVVDVERRPQASPQRDPPVEVERGAARVLLSEAERVELARNDLVEAFALVEEALSKSPTRTDSARGRLRGVQLAMRLDQVVDARRHFEAAAVELNGSEVVDGASALALALLAIGDEAEPGSRTGVCDRIVALHARGELRLPGAEPALAVEGERFVVREDPRREAFETLLAARCPEFEPSATIDAVRASIGSVLDSALVDAWSIARVPGGYAFARTLGDARPESPVRVALATTDQVEQRLVELATRRGLIATGITLDVLGTRDDRGTALRAPVELADGVLSITVRHPDPDAIAASARRRATWLRAGLLAMAASIGAATVFAHRALVRERRLAELRSRFVANVSHELRTPVASILLMAENLESGRAGPDASARYHRAIRGEALRLRRLVEDVLDFSRIERGRRIAIEREDTDMDAWCESLAAELREITAQQGLDLAFHADRDLGRAILDAEALRRALLNLVDNAAKHSGAHYVAVAISADRNEVRFVVRDRGPGIPPARRTEIFEPFARLDDDRGATGAGLGLAIVREIAQAHGGSAHAVEPDTSLGAQFEVRIPREEPPTP